MFCPNCGKQVKDNDNFCRYCGANLKEEDSMVHSYVESTPKIESVNDYQHDKQTNSDSYENYENIYHNEENNSNFDNQEDVQKEDIEIPEYDFPKEDSEELVLYDVQKHFMALFWPIVLTPVFFVYFWQIFLNTHSFFSWVVAFAILTPIVYPILRYSSDKIIITTKYMRIQTGIIKKQEINIPLRRVSQLVLEQTTVGRILNYGTLVFKSSLPDRDTEVYGYIKDFDEFAGIIDNPVEFVRESLNDGY